MYMCNEYTILVDITYIHATFIVCKNALIHIVLKLHFMIAYAIFFIANCKKGLIKLFSVCFFSMIVYDTSFNVLYALK